MAKRANTSSPKTVHVAERPKNAKLAALQPPSRPKQSVEIPAKPLRPVVSERPTSDDLQAIFGENLKAARLKSGLKQTDIAERIGWTQQRLSLIEAGKQNITLKTMVKLARVVDHDVITMLQRIQPDRKKN